MLITPLLATDRIFTDAEITSKKKLLEFIAEQAADDIGITKKVIFNKLLERERLGSTGLGHGFAVPHARLETLDHAHACFLRLNDSVNYDAMDQMPVDLIFVLFIPEASTEEHLQILATLAKIFSKPQIPAAIRSSENAQQIMDIISQAEQQD